MFNRLNNRRSVDEEVKFGNNESKEVPRVNSKEEIDGSLSEEVSLSRDNSVHRVSTKESDIVYEEDKEIKPEQQKKKSSIFFNQIADKIADTAISTKSPSKITSETLSQPQQSQNKTGFFSNLFSLLTANTSTAKNSDSLQNNSNFNTRKILSPTSQNSQSLAMLGLSVSNAPEPLAPINPRDEEEGTVVNDSKEKSSSENDTEETFEEYESEEDEPQEEGDELSWVEWYCSLQGHDLFLEVSEEFIDDDFNLIGLPSIVPYYQEALEMIQDTGPEGVYSKAELQIIESSAEMLYALIHQRFLLTKSGRSLLHQKYLKKEYGVCPRVFCENQAVLPVGLSDSPNRNTVKFFCPRCLDIYTPSSSSHSSVDGCAFGTSAAHVLFLSQPQLKSDIKSAWSRMYSNKFDQVGIQETGTYTGKIFGFKIHRSSPSSPRMQWLRKIVPNSLLMNNMANPEALSE